MDHIKKIFTQEVIGWLGGSYSETLGDGSNPDYFGPKAVEELVENLFNRLGENCSLFPD